MNAVEDKYNIYLQNVVEWKFKVAKNGVQLLQTCGIWQWMFCAHASPYMCVFVQEVEAMLIDSYNARGTEGGGAATEDVEEWGAEHGECTDQPCVNSHCNRSWHTSERFLKTHHLNWTKTKLHTRVTSHTPQKPRLWNLKGHLPLDFCVHFIINISILCRNVEKKLGLEGFI